MSKQIEIDGLKTNLRVLDKVKNIQDGSKYQVMNIDLNEARVVLLKVYYDDAGLVAGYSDTFVIDLMECDNFEII